MTRQALLSALQIEYPALTLTDELNPMGEFEGNEFNVSDGSTERLTFLNITNLVDGGAADSVYVNAAKAAIDALVGN